MESSFTVITRIWRFIVGVLVTAAFANAQAQPADAAPPLAVGEKWTWSYHNTGDKRAPYIYFNEVQRVDANNAWLYGESEDPNTRVPKYWWRHDQKRGTRLEFFGHDANAPQSVGARISSVEKSDDLIQFPLTPGKSYSAKEIWTNGRGHTDWKVEVKAQEKVKTPAGEFDAYRIVYTGWWTNTAEGGFTGKAQMTRWWSPSVKNVVRAEYEDWNTSGRPWARNAMELVKWETRPAAATAVPAAAASAAK